METSEKILTEKRLATMEQKIDNLKEDIGDVKIDIKGIASDIKQLDSKYSAKWVESGVIAIITAIIIAAVVGLFKYFMI